MSGSLTSDNVRTLSTGSLVKMQVCLRDQIILPFSMSLITRKYTNFRVFSLNFVHLPSLSWLSLEIKNLNDANPCVALYLNGFRIYIFGGGQA